MQEPLRIWQRSKLELIPYVSCVAGVLLLGIEIGMAIAIGISLGFLLIPIARFVALYFESLDLIFIENIIKGQNILLLRGMIMKVLINSEQSRDMLQCVWGAGWCILVDRHQILL